ncbi:MAG: protein kinase [Gloeocapsa sp. UFS-A4-WI-NPMV-4B04]|nr:protein kinase [Gloeocapsa sp. UFS-A4-WI-NPMV-4B04]
MTTLLNNRYQIIQVLGAGGFGETFLAEDTYMPSRRRCVIKQLKPVTNDPQMYRLIQQRFQREAATLEALGESSDQIPKLFAYFSENGQFHLVQEWIQGQTLTDKVASVGPLSENAVREILVSLLLVLDYVHSKGIIYRDIKPDNIIIRQSNNQPVLIDFGAVKETMTATVNSHGKPTYSIVLGTPGFMAPEQASGRPIYASDIYSMGMTAIYLLTGKLPQELEIDSHTEEMFWQQYAANVSPHLAAVLNKAIQYHPRDRYTTAIKMLDALQPSDSSPPQQPATEAILVMSPVSEKLSNQVAPVLVPQSVPVVKRTPIQGQQKQKNLLLGSLLAGTLLSAAIVVGIIRNQQPQSAIITTPQPQANSQQTVTTTPSGAESPVTPESAAAQPTPVINQSPSPETKPSPIRQDNAAQRQENEQQNTPSPSPAFKVPQSQENEHQNNSTDNIAKNTIPGFPTGTSEIRLKAALGKPTRTSNGYFPNTRALLYELKPNQVSLGYIFDKSSGRLRQTEVSFAQSVEPSVMQATLKKMLGDRALINASQGLQQVYDRRANEYSFNVGGLQGVIQRNNSDRIYIGVWEADLH